MFGCQQVLIKQDKDTKAILEYLCSESNNLYNCAVYYGRQMWFKTKRITTGFDLCTQMKNNLHYKAGNANSMQQTCVDVGEAFKSFKQLLVKYKSGELTNKPKPPNYRKSGGLFKVTYNKQRLKLINNQIRFPLGKQVKAWFSIKEFFLPFPSNLKWESIREVRIIPRNGVLYAEFIYRIETSTNQLDSSKVLGIDHGLNNWLTCVSNIGSSFIVDGKHVKALNQWYHKQTARLKEGKPQGFWSKTLANITEKRNRQMRDAVNKAARIVINYCLKNDIGTIVFGWNKGQKDSINLGSKTNQKFVSIPTARLKERIAQLCQQYNIHFEETEESYTSKASFLDKDELPKYGEKPVQWQSSGKRVKRGLFRTGRFEYINSDCNGAGNILRKVQGKLGFDLSRLNRGVMTTPIRIRLNHFVNRQIALQ